MENLTSLIEKNREVFNRAYEKALEEQNKDRINLDNFVGQNGYYRQNIEEHGRRAESLTRRYEEERCDNPEEEEAKMLSIVLEAIVIDQIKKGWFGQRVDIRKTSDFDDLINHVDAVAEIKKAVGVGHLALAIDATHTSRNDKLEEKFRSIKTEIEEGRLTEIEYYENSQGTYRGRLRDVPRVVVGVDRETLFELAGLWVNGEDEKLKNHPVSILFLKEMLIQLEAFKKYTEQLGEDRLVERYNTEIETIRDILNQSDKQKIELGKLEDDYTWQAIQAESRMFNYSA
jgi:hypothetical protein